MMCLTLSIDYHTILALFVNVKGYSGVATSLLESRTVEVGMLLLIDY